MSATPTAPPRAALALPLAFGAALGLLSAAVAWFALGGIPHVSDEVAYTLQARLFAALQRVGPGVQPADLLQIPFWHNGAEAYSVFPPGWPALLAPGEALGLGWLVNPLLAAGVPPLLYLLAREWMEEAPARLAALVVALSPGVWILSASRMAHTSVLLALLVAAVVVQRGRDRLWAWGAASLAVAYVVLARPFDAAWIAAPMLLFGLWRAPSWRARALLVGLPGVAAALTLWDNLALTGDALVFPVNAWYDQIAQAAGRAPGCNRLGFGADVGCQPWRGQWGYTPPIAWEQALVQLERFDKLLLGVHGGGLVALVGAALLGRRGLALGLGVLWVLAGYALYWSPGGAYGARFLQPAMLAVAPLVALGAWRLLRRHAWWALPLLVLAASAPVASELADDYWCVDRGLVDHLDQQGISRGVLFMQETGQRDAGWPSMLVGLSCDGTLESLDAASLIDPVHPTEGLLPLTAPDTGAEATAILQRWYPDSEAWLVQHDVARDERVVVPLGGGGL